MSKTNKAKRINMEGNSLCSNLRECFSAVQSKITNHPTSRTKQFAIKGKLVVDHSPGQSGPGKSASVRIYSRTEADPKTGKGKLSGKAYLKHGKSNRHSGTKTTTYKIQLQVEPEFGIPGALVIDSHHKHKFFLQSAILETPDNQVIHFDCRSWVYPSKFTKTDRIFFSNTSYLPSETPSTLVKLRKEELISLRGDGTGERKEWDRIYDYDYYNDLGNPDKGQEYSRPVLGGSDTHPYPRRGRTGRPPSNADPSTESRPDKINLDIYVPPDERFSPNKLSEFIGNSIHSIVHFLIPEAKSLINQNSSHFQSFDEIRDLFSDNRSQVVEGWITEKLKQLVPDQLTKDITHKSKADPLKFPIPQIITENELVWKNDEEFGHQMLAGINAPRIRCVQKFPPQSKNGVSSIKELDIEHNLDGLTLTTVMNQWRLFILDHHDYLLPFLNRINTKGVCAYASRTLFFLRSDATLKPLAIELSLPNSPSRVFLQPRQDSQGSQPSQESQGPQPSKDTQGPQTSKDTQGPQTSQDTQEAAMWELAKAHVLANDSAYHQLISHWLHTHAVVEPFIIATRRQLSVLHPIYRLLDPHFKDTMHINALARSILINSGGILEKILFSGEISMELSSELYKGWRFDEQALPTDLLKRRMALEDSENPTGVQILFQDYPYGLDGLEIWLAIKTWVTDFCCIFYKDDNSVSFDEEIQAWWSEIKKVGHGDKRNETWWYEMKSLADLTEALTTLIWIASALHASVNFGQYTYAGYPPNRPTLCRKFIPKEGTNEFAEFLRDPDKYYLNMLPERFEMTLAVALVEVLSRHTSDEVYLGQRSSSEWTDNTEVQQKFNTFKENLQEIEKKIMERNRNPKLKNRWGLAKIPYKLMYPDTSNDRSKGGITGKGIPNSISI